MENFPTPKVFSEEDLNAGTPRLFEDEYYVHYFKYASKAGMCIYNFAVPLVFRKDVEESFTYCLESKMAWVKQIKVILKPLQSGIKNFISNMGVILNAIDSSFHRESPTMPN